MPPKKNQGEKRKAKDVDWNEHIDHTPSLQEIQELVEELAATTSSNRKLDILKDHPHCVKVLLYANHPYWLYHVTSSNVKKNICKQNVVSQGKDAEDVFQLLDMLKDGVVSGHAALGTVIRFLKKNAKFQDLILDLLDKNLKIRCGTATINKAFPGLVPEFQVALANAYDEKATERVDFGKERWFASRKMDGVRVLAFIEQDGRITFRSREGNEFGTLQIVKESLAPYGLTGVVLDGEVCIVEGGKENFKKTVGSIKRQDSYIKNPRYYAFDVLTDEEFRKAKSERTFSERQGFLLRALENPDPWDVLHIVKQTEVKDKEHLAILAAESNEKGWEGLILRRDAPYEGKRTNDMLKVKRFFREEYGVEDIEVGPFRVIIDHKEVTVKTLRAVTIVHKGKAVSVGSGFSLEEREKFSKDPTSILGKTISVQYFEETEDGSLRFPTYLGLYGENRDI